MPNDLHKRGLTRARHRDPAVRDPFWNWSNSVRALITFFAIVLVAHVSHGQTRSWTAQNLLPENASFSEADLAELQLGEPIATRLTPRHKEEVAVYGVVRVQAPPEVFLQSFLDTLATKSNPAILEIGRFSSLPTFDDLKTLTLETGDIEDLKKCVVGNCELKLSAEMIDRFQKSVDWESSDYAAQATKVYKLMLLDYVRDYLNRGDRALIEYTDKPKTVSLLDGQRALLESLPIAVAEAGQNGLVPIENTIVWSKIKFGLKPVLAINHTLIFKSQQKVGPQILVLSKQIYANHYFDASIALTGLTRNLSGSDEYYLFYENHSLADGLRGLFTGIKRRLIEHEAVGGLRTVMQQTKIRLEARALNQSGSGLSEEPSSGLIRLRVPRKQLLLLVICLTALAMLALAGYQRKTNTPLVKTFRKTQHAR
ncbi:MAG TPA: hypothetical protein VLA93_06325 [Pyrinomonadaceae bacterium]|nr:hypothetical protein [Pyrinomonadaceae bacterium]